MTERNEGRERGPWLALLQLEADLPQEGGSTGESLLPIFEKLQRIASPDDVVPSQLLHCRPTLRGLVARLVASRICNPSCRQMTPTCRRCGSISCRALSVRWSAGPLSYFRGPSLCLISWTSLPQTSLDDVRLKVNSLKVLQHLSTGAVDSTGAQSEWIVDQCKQLYVRGLPFGTS